MEWKISDNYRSREALEMFHIDKSAENPHFDGFLLHTIKTMDKVVRYGGNNQVDFFEHTEEELVEIKVQEEQEEKKRLEKQREREKAYREKRKAKKLAENGGEIVKTKVCPHCQKEFIPTSNRQIFCSKDCCYQARQDKTKADREAEKRKSLLSSACLCCVWQYLLAYTQSAEIMFRRMSKAKSQREIFEILPQEAKGEIKMQRFITDERTGIQYELIGDITIPA